MTPRRRWCRIVLATVLTGAVAAHGHEIRPAYLQIEASAPGDYQVLWKQPVAGARLLPIMPVFPEDCTVSASTVDARAWDALVRRFTLRCPHGLDGQTTTIDGLAGTITDVMLQVTLADGTQLSRLLKPASPSATIGGDGPQVLGYLLLGIEHLLFGYDHILFVVSLMFFTAPVSLPSNKHQRERSDRRWLFDGRSAWPGAGGGAGAERTRGTGHGYGALLGGRLSVHPGALIKTITAFTAAHSVTLSFAALDLARLPQAPVEAVIALSIVFLAVEKLRGTTDSITAKHTWIVAFVFGLLHGFGFAGALADIGLPKGNALLALLLFNLGVEIGQLAIVALGILVIWPVVSLRRSVPRPVVEAPLYVTGSLAAYWLVARVAAIVG